MRTALLVELFQQLPALPDGDFLAGRSCELQPHLERFRQSVALKYSEGTLQRLLADPAAQARRAALLALGLTGGMGSNALVAERLQDEEQQVRRLATDALWNIWFRAEGESQKRELQRLSQLKDPRKSLRGLNAMIQKLPRFAEAYNQRAIVQFRTGEFLKAVADCERVLELNPFHFGAQAGLGQCLMRLKRPRAALRAFHTALEINPELEEIAESVRTLEEKLGEGRD
jgi:tetratricopeptide (TPR) repeat protein